jgi:iron complex transport system permease protein
MMTLSTESVSLQVVMSWLMGAIQAPSGAWMWTFLVLSLALFLLSFTLARPLDLLGLGENMALAYGLNVKKFLVWGLVMGSAAAALAVSVGGIVAFVGLAAPHIGRHFTGTRHKALIPFSALTGAIIVVLADVLSRSLLPPGEIPLGLITAICGGPFFLYLLSGRSK